MDIELVADYECVIGEGPLWHPDEQRIYWLDIANGRMFRADPATGVHEQFYSGDIVGGTTLQADGSLLLFMGRGAVTILKDGMLSTVIEERPGELDSRFNDVIADPRGRVFCGTMGVEAHPGSLYRLDTDGSIHRILEGIGVSNGLGFSPDRKQVYYTDSPKREIYTFDYDEETGELSNRRVFAKTTESEGFPDGLTVDAEGYVWSARWGGGCVARYAPDGSQVQTIEFPAEAVSSVLFGGVDYADLYVTTANGHDKAQYGSGSGALYRVRAGVSGVPEFRSRIGL
jgi:D-xylonolactonase